MEEDENFVVADYINRYDLPAVGQVVVFNRGCRYYL